MCDIPQQCLDYDNYGSVCILSLTNAAAAAAADQNLDNQGAQAEGGGGAGGLRFLLIFRHVN